MPLSLIRIWFSYCFCAEVVTYIINKIWFYRIPIVNVLSEKEQRTCGRNKRSTPRDKFKNDEDRHIDTHEMKVEIGRPTNVANNNSEIEINIIPPKESRLESSSAQVYDTETKDGNIELFEYDCGEFCGDYDYTFESTEEKSHHEDFGGFGKIFLDFQNYLTFATLDRCQKDVAYKIPLDRYCDIVKELEIKCFEQSLLEIWNYDENLLTELTTEDIISAIKRYDRSPYFGYAFEYTSLLGGMKYNSQHELVSASSIMYNFPTTVDLDQIEIVSETKNAGTEFDPLDANNLLWQEKAIEVGK